MIVRLEDLTQGNEISKYWIEKLEDFLSLKADRKWLRKKYNASKGYLYPPKEAWNVEMEERFNKIAGNLMRRFRYHADPIQSSLDHHSYVENVIISKSKPLVSIGMTVYNAEKFLKKTLDSLLAQDYENIEIIICDNASEDSSSDICLKYAAKDKRIKYHRNIKNIGSAANFNQAFTLSSGEYFMWAADHDLWEKDYVSSCLSVMESDPEVVLAYGYTRLIDENDKTIEIMSDRLDTSGLPPEERFKKVMWTLSKCNSAYGLIRSDSLKKIRLGLEVIGPDHILLEELSFLGTFVQIKKPLFLRRQNRAPEKTDDRIKRQLEFILPRAKHYLYLAWSHWGYEHLEVVKRANLPNSKKAILIDEVVKYMKTNRIKLVDDEVDKIIKRCEEYFLKKELPPEYPFPKSLAIEGIKSLSMSLPFTSHTDKVKYALSLCYKALEINFSEPYEQDISGYEHIDFNKEKNQISNSLKDSNRFGKEILETKLKDKKWENKLELYSPYFDFVSFINNVENPSISIIVISWQMKPETLKSFELLNSQRNQNFELIFVDNGAKPGEFESLKPFTDTYIELSENTGAYLARNVGAVFAKAPILLFIDDDGIPDSKIVKAHLDAFKKYDVIAVRGIIFPKTIDQCNDIPQYYYLGSKPFPFFSCQEGNTSYKSEVFYKVGGWDDEIKFGHGGIDLSLRLMQIEPDMRKQIYSPDPVLYHNDIKDPQLRKKKQEKHEASRKRLLIKHPNFDSFIASWNRYYQRQDLLILRNTQDNKKVLPNQEEDMHQRAISLNYHGESLFNEGNLSGALLAFSKAIEINPNLATAHNNLGVLYWQAGEVQKAIDYFEKALKIDPNDRDAILNYGNILTSLEKLEDARNLYSLYLRRNPENKEVLAALETLERNTASKIGSLQATYDELWERKLNDPQWLKNDGKGRVEFCANFLKATNKIAKGTKLLDIGCGRGTLKYFLNTDVLLYGVDISEKAILEAGKIYAKADVVDLNAEELPYEEASIDIVTALDVIEHVFDPLFFLREIHRVLKPGGQVVLSTPNILQESLLKALVHNKRFPKTSGDSFPYDGGHIHFFTYQDVFDLMKAVGFARSEPIGPLRQEFDYEFKESMVWILGTK